MTSTSNSSNSLGSLSVNGNFDGGSLVSASNLGTIVLGGMRNSSIYAGVVSGFSTSPSSSGLPDGQNDFEGDRTIQSIKVNGVSGQTYSFVNSNIAAFTIGTVRLVDIQTSNSGVPFGVAAANIGSSGGLTDLGDFKLRLLRV